MLLFVSGDLLTVPAGSCLRSPVHYPLDSAWAPCGRWELTGPAKQSC